MSIGSAPTPPNPYATAAAQEQENEATAQYQAEVNNVNQVTPYGSLTYTQTGTNPDGSPIFQATTALNPQEQALFNNTVSTQNTVGQEANTLATNLSPSLTQAPNLSNEDLIKQMMGWQTNYVQPYFNMQQSNLNSALANEGVTQGSPGYDNAQLQLGETQGGTIENALASDEGQAYNQALETYQAPIQTLATLLGEGQPASVNSSLTQTPQETIQPANLEGLVEQNYAQQNQNYENTISGLFGIGSALAGGIGRIAGSGMLSDRRKKRNIVRVGWLNDGTPIYRFRYLDDPRMTIGIMAQDIIDLKPEAVMVDGDGYMLVDYEKATEASVRPHHG